MSKPRPPVKVREIIQGPADHKVWRLLLMVKRKGIRGNEYDSIEYIREIDDGQPLVHVERFRKTALGRVRHKLPGGSTPWIRIEPVSP